MSLFKTREWWSTKLGAGEEFDRGCIAVGNVDNAPDGKAKIVTGSFNGILRIHCPSPKEYRIEDLLLESDVGLPIIQVAVGQFLPDSQNLGLAVLNPKRLVVYNVTPTASQAGQNSYHTLTQAYEHVLGRTAASMVYGKFGGVYNKDYLCVQSLDGQVSFFEHEAFAFSRFLPNILVAGPMCYSKKMDAFLVINSKMEIECFKYQHLVSSSDNSTPGGNKDRKKSNIMSEWVINLGEHAFQVSIGRYSRSLASSQADILVLGEHTLFCIKEGGVIRQQKRLDYTPCCMAAFPVPPDSQGMKLDNLLVGTTSSNLLVYRDNIMMWAAKLPYDPVTVMVEEFQAQRGLVVSLSETGNLDVWYMGTDPPSAAVLTAGKELDYDQMDEEHRKLMKQIRETLGSDEPSSSGGRVEPNDRVVVRAQVPSAVNPPSAMGPGNGMPHVAVRVSLSYTGNGKCENVSLTAQCPDGVNVSEERVNIAEVKGGRSTPNTVTLNFWATAAVIPTDMTASLSVTYTTDAGAPRCASCFVPLPMALFVECAAPIMNASFKITFDTNRDPVSLTTLFDDVPFSPDAGHDAEQKGAKVLTLQHHMGGPTCTILVSKNAGRYRIQADAVEALWMVSHELCRRIRLYFKAADRGSNEPLQIFFKDQLSAVEYVDMYNFFTFVDDHWRARKRLEGIEKGLADRAQQFRAIQKRLLVRYKDKNPSSLNQLDILLKGTYEQMFITAEEYEQAQTELTVAANRLGCVVQLVNVIIRTRCNLDEENFNILQQSLSSTVRDSPGNPIGWEEMTEAAMTQLLRTALAKNVKERNALPPPMQALPSIDKLVERTRLVFSRLSKGGSLVVRDGADIPENQYDDDDVKGSIAKKAPPALPMVSKPPTVAPIPEGVPSLISAPPTVGGGH